jgi:multiple sugar transport system ATP-binding protein
MRDGVIQQLAAPSEIYHRPANLFVAGFIGAPSMNFLEGRIEMDAGVPTFSGNGLRIGLASYPFATPPQPGPVTLGIRPEHIALDASAKGLQAIDGKVSVVEPMGADAVVWFDWEGISMSLRVMGDVALSAGDSITPGLDIAKASLFGADGVRL